MSNESYSKLQMENAMRVVKAIERIPDNKQSLFLLVMESMMLGVDIVEQMSGVKAEIRDSA